MVDTIAGSHCRPDGKVAYGYSLFRGKRSNMEDFHHAQVSDEHMDVQGFDVLPRAVPVHCRQ